MDKNLDVKGRWRDTTVGFRLSKQESDDLNTRVKLSGLTKQNYITNRLSEKEIVVVGNPRVYKALRNKMESIYIELRRLESLSQECTELLETIRLVAITLNGLKEENND